MYAPKRASDSAGFRETEENAGNRRFALHYKIYSGIIREKLFSGVKTMSKKLVAYSRRGWKRLRVTEFRYN